MYGSVCKRLLHENIQRNTQHSIDISPQMGVHKDSFVFFACHEQSLIPILYVQRDSSHVSFLFLGSELPLIQWLIISHFPQARHPGKDQLGPVLTASGDYKAETKLSAEARGPLPSSRGCWQNLVPCGFSQQLEASFRLLTHGLFPRSSYNRTAYFFTITQP